LPGGVRDLHSQDPKSGAARWKTNPLFGCYFFTRIVDQWRVLERTVGVLSVVKAAGLPARCPDEEIATLIARSDPDGASACPPA
jgi:hypothetical protein